MGVQAQGAGIRLAQFGPWYVDQLLHGFLTEAFQALEHLAPFGRPESNGCEAGGVMAGSAIYCFH